MQALFLLLISQVNSRVCDRYFCEDSNHLIPSDGCAILTKSESHYTYYFKNRRCGTNEVCIPSSTNLSLWECLSAPIASLSPGDKCKNKEELCDYGPKICNSTSLVCEGFKENDSCSFIVDCEPGLRCSNSKCLPQLKENEKGCGTDYDCMNGLGCYKMSNATENLCVKYFTLPDYHPISDSNVENEGSYFCKNYYAFKNSTGNYCTEAVKSKHSISNTCSTNLDCVSDIHNLQQKCVCGMNEEGNSYCELFLGDKEGLKFFNLTKEWIYSDTNQMHCNTASRFNLQCARDWMSSENYMNFVYRYYGYYYYPQQIGIQECVRINIFPNDPY